MILGRRTLRLLLLLFPAALTLIVSPLAAQAPISPGTLLVELTAEPASQLVLSRSELESRLCDAVRLTKDPDPLIINYDDDNDVPADPPDPPPGGGLRWDPLVDTALLPDLVEAAPRLVYQLGDSILFDERGQATTTATPVRLCGRATKAVSLSCGDWSASLRLDKEQKPSELSLFVDGSGDGGSFTLETSHALRLSFRHLKSNQTISWVVDRHYAGFGAWRRSPGDDGLQKTGSYRLDTDCDGYQETWVDGTTELHLGWSGGENARVESACLGDSTAGGRLCIGPQTTR